jgi:hypothetical protein
MRYFKATHYDKIDIVLNGKKVESFHIDMDSHQYGKYYWQEHWWGGWHWYSSNYKLINYLKNGKSINLKKIDLNYDSYNDLINCDGSKYNLNYITNFKINLKQNTELLNKVLNDKKIDLKIIFNKKQNYESIMDNNLEIRNETCRIDKSANINIKETKYYNSKFAVMKNLKIYNEGYKVIPKIFRIANNQIKVIDERNKGVNQIKEKINMRMDMAKNKEVEIEYKTQWQPSYYYNIEVSKETINSFESLDIKFETKTID